MVPYKDATHGTDETVTNKKNEIVEYDRSKFQNVSDLTGTVCCQLLMIFSLSVPSILREEWLRASCVRDVCSKSYTCFTSHNDFTIALMQSASHGRPEK